MKTKVLAALVATMAVGATCAFAANPFVDVPSDSWAYKSVVELADAGIIQGVDGQYFQGNRNITRYEAAEMVAKAMAHMDKASVEQRALINKLADEYADELNNLGVRVSNLENKVGNVKLSGDARLRYRYQNDTKDDKGVTDDSSWDYRVRLRATANVNDKTTVNYGFSTNNHSFADNGSAKTQDNDVYTDVANISTNLGNLNATVGRYQYVLGNGYGFNYGDTFDGAQLKYNNGKFAATAGYGKFKEGNLAGSTAKKITAGAAFDADGNKLGDFTSDDGYVVAGQDINGVKTGYGELEGFFGNGSAAGVYYNSFNGQKDFYADDLWGAYASVNFGSKWNALANYENISFNNDVKNINNDDNASVWIGKLTYGKSSLATPKSWDAWVEYLNAEDGSFIGGSTNSWRFGNQMDNIESWGAGIDYTFAKNAQFQVMQSFATSTKDGTAKDPEEQTKAQFVFAF